MPCGWRVATSLSAPAPKPTGFPHDYVRWTDGPAPDERPPVVLVGEILAGGAAWRQHAGALAPHWRVGTVTPVVTALAGEGHRPPEGWRIPDEAESLLRLLDAEGITQAHLGGWSLGGTVALELAMAHPERVRSLLLVEAQAWWLYAGQPGRPAWYEAMRERFGHFHVERVEEEHVARFLHHVGAVPEHEDPRESRGWRLANANRNALPFSWWVITHTGDPARLDRLTMPVLVVHGDATTPYDASMSADLARRIPGAQRLVLEGMHTSHIASFDAFMAAYIPFITRAETP